MPYFVVEPNEDYKGKTNETELFVYKDAFCSYKAGLISVVGNFFPMLIILIL